MSETVYWTPRTGQNLAHVKCEGNCLRLILPPLLFKFRWREPETEVVHQARRDGRGGEPERHAEELGRGERREHPPRHQRLAARDVHDRIDFTAGSSR